MFIKVFKWTQGRTTAFCLAFFVSGNIMHLFGKLDATYISFMVALFGAVIGHSIKEDMLAPASAGSDNATG